jgi:polysaccharide chain length determinant protein (PEP-CTERM system associated)
MTPPFDAHPERPAGPEPDAVLDVWRRRKWIGLLVFGAVLTGVVTMMLSLPDLYRATATVLVERQEVSDAFVRQSVTAALETRIQTIHERVMSRARLGEVVTRLNLYPELRGLVPFDDIVGRMRRDVRPLQLKGVDSATGRSATIAFTLGYSGRDPQTVAEVTNTLVGYYVEENTESRERLAARTAEFLEGQLGEVRHLLEEQERRTSEFALLHTAELPEQLEANLAALDRVNSQLRLNGEHQLRALERRERLERELADARSGAIEGPAASTPAARLARLEEERAELRRQFSDRYPDVVRLNAEIAALEHQGARDEAGSGEGGASIPPADRAGRARQAIEAVSAELQSLEEQQERLRRMIADYESRIESAPRRQREMQQLSRGDELTRERYQTLLKQYEDARIAARLEEGQAVEQFRVLDPALPPLQPAAPNRLWLGIMGLVAAAALAVGAIVAVERIDTTFHTADELRAFVRVPTLAAIRRVPTRADLRRRRLRSGLFAAGAILGLALIAAGTYYVAGGNEQIVRMLARGTL